MPLYDITEALRGGKALPYSDDCVMTCRTAHGDIILKFDAGISRTEAAEILSQIAAGMAFPEPSAEKNTPALKICPAPAAAEAPAVNSRQQTVNPESITEDLVRLGSYTVYRLTGGDWWWVKWRSDTGEMWGLSGPLMGAAEMRSGPFQTYDETMANMMYYRSNRDEKDFQG
jgi:hypothetical protein